MRRLPWIACLLAVTTGAAQAREQQVESRVVSVGLFKNGLAVVARILEVPGPGTYRLEQVPRPVHGTFWVTSDAEVTTRIAQRTVQVPAGAAPGRLQQDLAGCEVEIHFAEGGSSPVTGRVAASPKDDDGELTGAASSSGSRFGYVPRPVAPGRFLVLEDGGNRVYVDTTRIASLRIKGAKATVERRKDVMLFEVEKTPRRRAVIRIFYLAEGMAWAPSYRVDISHPDKLVLVQKAVIKNELTPLENTAVRLISGFPSVEFGHVTSPMAPGTTWQGFFASLGSTPRGLGHVSMGNVVTQQAIRYNPVAPDRGLDLSAIPTGDGVDLHHQDIGRRSLRPGESLAIQTASARAPYKRVVEWIVPDTRGAYGHVLPQHRREQDPDAYEEVAWDAIRFRNPFGFPMTTAPAMIVDKAGFCGQRTSTWVNRGEMTTLRITKALSVRTRHLEEELKQKRKDVFLGGDRYYRATVQGTLRANNHRNETISLIIQRSFSGNLLKADRKPACTLLPEGIDSVNRRNRCTWRLALEPGQQVELDYRYNVLVRY